MKTLFEVMTGSRAYGMELDNSDYDVLRVVVNGTEEYLGLRSFKESHQFKNGKNDVTVYDVRFYGKLLCAGNPNAILPLFFSENNRAVVAPEFEDWLVLPRRFLGPRTVDAFRGMVYRQAAEFREFAEGKVDDTPRIWKQASTAMYMLWALKSLMLYGGLERQSEKVQLFRDVKRGMLSVDTVLRELEWLERTTTKEFLSGPGTLLRTQEEVFEEVNLEVVKTLRRCL